jgi:hypothetical protein
MASKQSPVVLDDQPTGETRPGHGTTHEVKSRHELETEAEPMFGYWPKEMMASRSAA